MYMAPCLNNSHDPNGKEHRGVKQLEPEYWHPSHSSNCMYGALPKQGMPFWGPHVKDFKDYSNTLGSTLGSPYFGKLPYMPFSQGTISPEPTPCSPKSASTRSYSKSLACSSHLDLDPPIKGLKKWVGCRK